MDMRAAVARVVELQQEGRALQAVVVRPARLEAASPAEANVLDAGAAMRSNSWRGDAARQHAQVGLDDLEHQRLADRR